MINFENIEIKFGDFVAIENLSLEIKEGEFFTFLGPSGCGKTTTLRSLVGFITPSKGKIYMNGEDITYKPIEKRGIGMVFQSYALFPTMTVRDNIEYGMVENKWDRAKIDERVKYVSSIVNLTEEQLNKNVSDLSGGQQQRVAIARSLSMNPEVVCLDEPLSNLDAKLRGSLRDELKEIQRQSGTTMIYVTHDQEEALSLSDRIAVFSDGQVQQVGTPREIYFHPKNAFVTTFIGDRFKLDNKFIQDLNNSNNAFTFDTSKEYYLMAESLRQKEEANEGEYDIEVKAKLLNEDFQGTMIKRDYSVNGSHLRSIVFAKDAKEVVDPENVNLVMNHNDFIMF